MVQIYSRYYPPQAPGLEFTEPTMAQQHFKDECDINNILKKYTVTGILPSIGPGQYLDCTDAGDYLSAIQTINQVDEFFSSLPAELRKQFNNDPAELLDFVSNDENIEKGIQMGLYQRTQSRHPLASPPGPSEEGDIAPKTIQNSPQS